MKNCSVNISHIIWGFHTGGMETMLVDIINEQVKLCNIQLIVINKGINKELLENIDTRAEVVLCNRKTSNLFFLSFLYSLLSFVKLNYNIWKFRPHIIHSHQDQIGRFILFPAVKVRTIHNTHSFKKDGTHYKRLFCISKAVKDYINKLGHPDGVVIYNGIHTDLVKSLSDNSKKKRIIKHFVSIGRLHRDKGQTLLIEAFHQIINIRGLKCFDIDIIGDGPQYNEIAELIKKYNLESYINLLGRKPRSFFYPLLCEYDLFILPSISEGFGLSLAEAISAKIPVITCDLPGPMEIIDGGHLGLSFITGDAMSLATQIESFLRDGYDSSKIQEAYNYVKENFDVKKTAEHYLEEYKTVCEFK